ncbi:MAG: fatty acid desaturase [Tardiphaga sp.]|nr:fatty acid desaturase [Tardiphaga sp.]
MTMEMHADRPQGRPLTPAQLKDLSLRSNAPGLLRAVSHFGAIALMGTLLWMVIGHYGVLFAVPLIVVQGYLVAFLFMPVHEAAHKTVFRTRSLNTVLGHLSSLTIMYPLEYYTLFHWDHHRFTQDPARDPELMFATVPTSDTQLAIAYSGIVYLFKRVRLMFRHAITGQVVVPWIPDNKRALVVREARLYVLVYLLLLVASIALSSWVLLWVWLIPLVVGQWFLRPYLFAEHTGCDHTRSAFENTRTTYTGRVMKWFTWNMPFHVEHHAYPSVPFHALPKLNAIVDDRIAYRGRGYLAVTRETLAWFRRARQSAS